MFVRSILAAALVVSLASPSSGQQSTVSVNASLTSSEIAQGEAAELTMVLSNSGAAQTSVQVTVSLVDPAGSSLQIKDFRRTVPAGSSVEVAYAFRPSQWFGHLGDYTINIGPSSLNAAPVRLSVTKSTHPVPRFADVTDTVGVATVLTADAYCDGAGYAAGAAWGDVEGDGDLDLFMPRPSPSEHSRLFINQGGVFVGQAPARNATARGVGATFVDFDNDGDQDLFIVDPVRNALLENDGQGYFSDVTAAAGLHTGTPDSSAAWGDYDNDGLLDLYITNWGHRCDELGRPTERWTYYPDHLFHNDGDGTFTDVSNLLSASTTTLGAGLQPGWFDYDRDGDQDLYLGNDFVGPQPRPNRLWRNDGPGSTGWRFTDVSAKGAGVGIHSMGLGFGDYDRDLDLDVAISNIGPTYLLRNEGDDVFTDQAVEEGVDRPFRIGDREAVSWGLAFYDLNNDLWEDLYVVMGSIDHATPQANALFTNTGSGFLDHSAPSGADNDGHGRGAAFADYDRDGRVDIFVVNQDGVPALLRNVTPKGRRRWLEVDLRGTKSNRDACGAFVTLSTSDGKIVRQVYCGSTSFASGNDKMVHFGTGNDRRVRRMVVKWPSGRTSVRKDLKTNRIVKVREGQ